MFQKAVRLILRMKKLLLLSAVLFGTAVASQAGGVHVDVGFRLPLPPLPRIVISHPAPVYVERERYYAPAPRYCEPPVVYVPRCEPPRYYHSHHSHHHGWRDSDEYRGYDHGDRYDNYRR